MSNNRLYYSHEAEQIANRQKSALALMVLALGAGMGAIIALMFAPRPGGETRDMMTKNAEGMLEQGRETTTKVVENLRKEFDGLRKDVEKRVENITTS